MVNFFRLQAIFNLAVFLQFLIITSNGFTCNNENAVICLVKYLQANNSNLESKTKTENGWEWIIKKLPGDEDNFDVEWKNWTTIENNTMGRTSIRPDPEKGQEIEHNTIIQAENNAEIKTSTKELKEDDNNPDQKNNKSLDVLDDTILYYSDLKEEAANDSININPYKNDKNPEEINGGHGSQDQDKLHGNSVINDISKRNQTIIRDRLSNKEEKDSSLATTIPTLNKLNRTIITPDKKLKKVDLLHSSTGINSVEIVQNSTSTPYSTEDVATSTEVVPSADATMHSNFENKIGNRISNIDPSEPNVKNGITYFNGNIPKLISAHKKQENSENDNKTSEIVEEEKFYNELLHLNETHNSTENPQLESELSTNNFKNMKQEETQQEYRKLPGASKFSFESLKSSSQVKSSAYINICSKKHSKLSLDSDNPEVSRDQICYLLDLYKQQNAIIGHDKNSCKTEDDLDLYLLNFVLWVGNIQKKISQFEKTDDNHKVNDFIHSLILPLETQNRVNSGENKKDDISKNIENTLPKSGNVLIHGTDFNKSKMTKNIDVGNALIKSLKHILDTVQNQNNKMNGFRYKINEGVAEDNDNFEDMTGDYRTIFDDDFDKTVASGESPDLNLYNVIEPQFQYSYTKDLENPALNPSLSFFKSKSSQALSRPPLEPNSFEILNNLDLNSMFDFILRNHRKFTPSLVDILTSTSSTSPKFSRTASPQYHKNNKSKKRSISYRNTTKEKKLKQLSKNIGHLAMNRKLKKLNRENNFFNFLPVKSKVGQNKCRLKTYKDVSRQKLNADILSYLQKRQLTNNDIYESKAVPLVTRKAKNGDKHGLFLISKLLGMSDILKSHKRRNKIDFSKATLQNLEDKYSKMNLRQHIRQKRYGY